MENELTIISNEQQGAITQTAQLRNQLVCFTRDVMVQNTDYGIIPGVQKPTLLKPGAEKLMSLFGYGAEFDCTERILDLNTKFLAYTYKATIRNKEGRIVSQCEGSVNSYEPKYRYSWIEKPKPSQEEQDSLKVQGLGKFRKSSSGWVWVEKIENPDLVGLQNTFQKMAEKRAFVGAILIATSASEFYTQDVEDMQMVDVEGTVVESKTLSKDKVRPIQPSTEFDKPAEQPKKEVAEVTEPSKIPGETRMAIQQAPDIATLYLIHKANTELQQDEQFLKLLSTKKAELRKGIAA